MPSDSVKIGIVGAGRYSRARVLPELKKVPGVEFSAVANSSNESSAALARDFGVARVAEDWRDVVSASDVDVLYNGTQAPMHRDVLLAAIEAGKHVLTMNPVAASSAEARELTDAVAAHPNLKVRGYLAFPAGPYTREDQLVLRLLAAGEIGTVHHAAFSWNTPFLAAGSYFEVLNRWLGAHKRVLAVRKQSELDGTRLSAAIVLAELASGAYVTYSHSTFTAEGAHQPRVELSGDKGTLVVHARREPGESVYLAKRGESTLQPVPIPADLQAAWDDQRVVPVEEQYVNWIRGGPEPSPVLLTFDQGLQNLEFADAFVASSRQGGTWVEMPVH
jgi:predicted dehydrogenase